MSTRRVGALLAGLFLILGLVVAHGWRQQEQVRALTADIRARYKLPAKDALLPLATLLEIFPDGLSREQVVRRLQPLRDRVVRERWVAGEDHGKNPFQAHIVELRVGRGGAYGVAFLYRDDALFDIDSPEHLGRVSDLPASSQQVWVGTGIP
jgi:hypothetical protein